MSAFGNHVSLAAALCSQVRPLTLSEAPKLLNRGVDVPSQPVTNRSSAGTTHSITGWLSLEGTSGGCLAPSPPGS